MTISMIVIVSAIVTSSVHVILHIISARNTRYINKSSLNQPISTSEVVQKHECDKKAPLQKWIYVIFSSLHGSISRRKAKQIHLAAADWFGERVQFVARADFV